MASSRVGARISARTPCGAACASVLRKTLEQRQAESGGLAGSGLGKAEHIAARENQRNGLGLNGRGV